MAQTNVKAWYIPKSKLEPFNSRLCLTLHFTGCGMVATAYWLWLRDPRTDSSLFGTLLVIGVGLCFDIVGAIGWLLVRSLRRVTWPIVIISRDHVMIGSAWKPSGSILSRHSICNLRFKEGRRLLTFDADLLGYFGPIRKKVGQTYRWVISLEALDFDQLHEIFLILANEKKKEEIDGDLASSLMLPNCEQRNSTTRDTLTAMFLYALGSLLFGFLNIQFLCYWALIGNFGFWAASNVGRWVGVMRSPLQAVFIEAFLIALSLAGLYGKTVAVGPPFRAIASAHRVVAPARTRSNYGCPKESS